MKTLEQLRINPHLVIEQTAACALPEKIDSKKLAKTD